MLVILGLPLARGAFGTVHCATLGGKKCIAKRAVKNKANADSYLREEGAINAKVCGAHPGSCHLAPFVGVCSIGWMDHLVWEACPGADQSLESYLRGDRLRALAHDLGLVDEMWSDRFDPQRLSHVLLTEMLSALAMIHSDGIVHRDVKPENWLVDKRTRSLRLIDFGSVCDSTAAMHSTMPVTMEYAPPELRLTPGRAWAYDVYSVALVWLRVVSVASALDFEALRAKACSQVHSIEQTLAATGALSRVSKQVERVLPHLLAADPHARMSASEALGCSQDDAYTYTCGTTVPRVLGGCGGVERSCELDFSCRADWEVACA